MPELHCPMLAVILYEGQGEISTHGIRTESKPVNLFAFLKNQLYLKLYYDENGWTSLDCILD